MLPSESSFLLEAYCPLSVYLHQVHMIIYVHWPFVFYKDKNCCQDYYEVLLFVFDHIGKYIIFDVFL